MNCRSQVPTSQRLLLKFTNVIFSPKSYNVNWFLDFHFYYMLLYFSSLVKLFRLNLRNFIQVCWATLNYNFSVSYYKTFIMEIDVFTGNLLLLIQSCILLICKFIYCMHACMSIVIILCLCAHMVRGWSLISLATSIIFHYMYFVCMLNTFVFVVSFKWIWRRYMICLFIWLYRLIIPQSQS